MLFKVETHLENKILKIVFHNKFYFFFVFIPSNLRQLSWATEAGFIL